MFAPLADIRVLDLSRVLAGPWASQILVDLGAEVIKVERPGTGDDTRAWGPPQMGGHNGESAYFLSCNRGKKSITVDLASPEGRDVIRALAKRSDVLIENFKVGDLAGHGLAHTDLQLPRLIYCSITGFGQDGPFKDQAGYDFVIQALGGLMSLTGDAQGAPQKVGVAIADLMAGMYAVVAVLAALANRDRTGEGQYIDLSLLDCQVAMLANQAMNYLVSGQAPTRLGNAHPNIVPYQSFATADGEIIVAVGNDGQFARLAQLIGRPGLADEFPTNPQRVRDRERLVPLIAERLERRESRDWLAEMAEAGIPCAPINDLDAVFAHPQVRARGLVESMAHGRLGTIPTVRSPMRFSGTAAIAPRPPPDLGEHTSEVLRDVLGLDSAAIADLRRQGIV